MNGTRGLLLEQQVGLIWCWPKTIDQMTRTVRQATIGKVVGAHLEVVDFI
jgi:hypothetical protein